MPPGAYRKPPITEAVIDVRFANPISAADIKRLRKRLEKDYPFVETRLSWTVAFGPTEARVAQDAQGLKLSSIDTLEIVLLHPQSITNSRLAPYNGWCAFRERSQAVLSEWIRAVGYQPPKRLGVRYINRLDVPGDRIDISEWLQLGVMLPRQLLLDMTSYAISVTAPLPDGANVIINTNSTDSPLLDYGSIILDIDVYFDNIFSKTPEDMWKATEELRNRKNHIFEMCITDRSRALFDAE